MQSSVNIQYTSTPASADIDFLTQKINQETPEFGEAHPFAFFIRDEKNQIIAGCNGSMIFGSIYTDQLWGHLNYRKNGLGHQLMEAVHDYGRKSGCNMATVATMSFHPPALKLRWTRGAVDFACPAEALQERRRKRTCYTHSSSCIFLKRSLSCLKSIGRKQVSHTSCQKAWWSIWCALLILIKSLHQVS